MRLHIVRHEEVTQEAWRQHFRVWHKLGFDLVMSDRQFLKVVLGGDQVLVTMVGNSLGYDQPRMTTSGSPFHGVRACRM